MKQKRGFAVMDKKKARELQSKGGKAGGHRWTKEEARAASLLGIEAKRKKKDVSQNDTLLPNL